MKKLLILLLISTAAFAKESLIDQKLTQCKNDPQNTSTIATESCYEAATKSWDKMLNEEYHLLMTDTELNKEFKDSLKKSQLVWVKYKDLYTDAIKKFYSNEQGSIWGLVYIENVTNITKDKALELHKLRMSTDLSASADD